MVRHINFGMEALVMRRSARFLISVHRAYWLTIDSYHTSEKPIFIDNRKLCLERTSIEIDSMKSSLFKIISISLKNS
jgi:hypothetical protein